MPRPSKNKITSPSEQSQSPPSSGMVMAPIINMFPTLDPNSRFCREFHYYLPCVKHCLDTIASRWATQYPKHQYDEMASRLCKKVGNHSLLHTFTQTDDIIIRSWAKQIEDEVLSGSAPVSSEDNNF